MPVVFCTLLANPVFDEFINLLYDDVIGNHPHGRNIYQAYGWVRLGRWDKATEALEPLSPEQRDFVLGNTKARMRMVAQYTIANARQGLVIGTDHAAEAVMGFFTKFGDGACDLAPLAGLVKDQVRQLAGALGAPEQLVHKVPTADLEELSPGKPDEAAHGVTYRHIDDFLQGKPVPEDAARVIGQTYDKTARKRQLPQAP